MMSQPMNRRGFFKMATAGAGSLAAASIAGATPQLAQAKAQSTMESTPDTVKAALGQLEKLTRDEMKSTGVPGIAVAVVYKDAVVFAKGFGVREGGKPEPVDADTVFQLASVSKPIGATVIAALVGQGRVAWDARISDLMPSFAMHEPYVTHEVTIKDMYAHVSGLPEHAGDLLEDMGYSREEVLRRLRFQPPKYPFRTHSSYTNFGMTAGAMAAATAAGMEWEAASEALLYQPLGMASTSSRFDDFMARKNRARGHVREGSKWVAKFQRNPDAQTPAGGVSSSANDLAKWMRLQLGNGTFEGKQVVNEQALAETHKPHIFTRYSPFTGLPGFYGLGWNVSYDPEGRLRLSHSGAFALGAATSVNLAPKEQLGVVVLTNAYPIGVAEGLGTTFMDLAIYGKPTQDWLTIYKRVFSDPAAVGVEVGFDYTQPPANPTPALPDDAYVGTYGGNDFFGEIEIVAAPSSPAGLRLVIGPKRQTFALTHYDRDTFTYETTGENAVGTTGVMFTIAPGGKASSVVVENLNVNSQGAFVRTETD